MTSDRRPGPGGGLVYAWPGPDPAPFTVPSVTTIIGAVSPGSGLVTWATRLVAAAAVDDVAGLAAAVEQDRAAAARALASAADRARDEAAALGSRVHNAIAAGAPRDVDDELRPYLEAWHRWITANGARVLLSERTVWTPRYAGTFDAILELDGTPVIVDFKTGRTLMPGKLALQLAAYASGEFVGEGGVVDRAATEILQRVDRAAVVHLRPELPDGLAVYRIPIDAPVRAAWTAALELHAFYRASRLVASDKQEEVTMDPAALARAANALRAAADALAEAAGAPAAPASLPVVAPLQPGDRHDVSHEPIRRNSRGLYCPTRLANGAWCEWAAA